MVALPYRGRGHRPVSAALAYRLLAAAGTGREGRSREGRSREERKV